MGALTRGGAVAKIIMEKRQLGYSRSKNCYDESNRFFSQYIALISMFASQMALQGFYFSYLFISPETSHLMVGVILVQTERER